MSAGKPFWEFEPDELAEPPERANLFRLLANKECQRHIELFQRHSDPMHLWKAWRCARACGPIPLDVLNQFAPYLDKLAAIELLGGIPARSIQREKRDWILRDYQFEIDARDAALANPEAETTTLSLTDIYLRVASRHKTTAGRVEQLVLQHERRDGRSKTSKNAKKSS